MSKLMEPSLKGPHLPEGEAKINRDTRHNFKLFEYKRNTNSWSTDFVRFDWEKIY